MHGARATDEPDAAGFSEAADWGLMARAVQARLRSLSEALGAQTQAQVLDCAQALESLARLCMPLPVRDVARHVDDAAQTVPGLLEPGEMTRPPDRRGIDADTGLPNRAVFMNHLEGRFNDSLRDQGAFTVLLMRLMPVDEILRLDLRTQEAIPVVVGARLRRCVRAPDFVGRMAGDVFGCLLGDVAGLRTPYKLIRRLRQVVEAPMHVGGASLRVRVACGHAENGVGAPNGETVHQMLQRALANIP